MFIYAIGSVILGSVLIVIIDYMSICIIEKTFTKRVGKHLEEIYKVRFIEKCFCAKITNAEESK